MDRIAVFGDLHGRSDMLQKLLTKLDEEYPGIMCFSTGDLIDRGPCSKQVVDEVIAAGIRPSRGNHDDTFDRAMQGEVSALHCHLQHGMKGIPTAESYGIVFPQPFSVTAASYRKLVPQKHKDFFRDLPLGQVVEAGGQKYVIWHAGLQKPNWEFLYLNYKDTKSVEDIIEEALEEFEDDILWNHKFAQECADIPGYIQVIGHMPVDEVVVTLGCIMVDTGCGHRGGKLSCIILPDMKIIEVIDE
jgi:diadenosine tetraphosphatase ApaH/serine/threonine PP2A family protein phosphatase